MRLLVLALALMIAGCASSFAQPSETRRFSGVYVNGWEVQLFEESAHPGVYHWVSMTAEARAQMARVLPPEFEPGEGVRVVTTFDGRLSRPGQYGHLGVYRHTVLIENVVEAHLERPAMWNCIARAETEWRAGEHIFNASALTSGPSCAQSAVLLIVRDSEGDIVWTDARPAAHVFGLRDARTATPMQNALSVWIAQQPRTTASLPDWPAGADGPAGEFPFRPEEWLDREAYLALRTEGAPMFCYAQGIESLSCLIERDERLERIGVQAFPG
ncbi:MAG: hypothetical protein AB7J28_16065 [Hyphomonadaceae bacterium]